MNIFGLHITGSSILKFIGMLSPVQKAVAALRKTSVGTQVEAAVRAIESKDMTGTQKFAEVLAIAIPLVAGLASEGGRNVALNEAEDIARALVQDTYNDVMSKSATGIAELLLKALGIK